MTAALLRPATQADTQAMCKIYAHAVEHSIGTFEEEPPKLDEMEQRRANLVAQKFPYLVAEIDHVIAGFAYVGPFRPRSAYRFTVEDSVYIHPDWHRRGVGRVLLRRLIDDCTAAGFRQMVAVVGGTDNHASIELHKSCGFDQVGGFQNIGFKFGRWAGIVFLQRALGDGASTLP
ncbi:GNAT family N-acetyltransferase [Roseiterribacter gracilis]|uniref:N-acetyltransferase n=1 Tax=Roseiterribacter gracilis TaxID=2812848 RepID=A0A8S8XAW1_9PROT|nr:N-acetyltransferase [Rhodospirillales bacterium TMPK1]